MTQKKYINYIQLNINKNIFKENKTMEENEFVRDEALEVVVQDLIETETALIYLRAGKC